MFKLGLREIGESIEDASTSTRWHVRPGHDPPSQRGGLERGAHLVPLGCASLVPFVLSADHGGDIPIYPSLFPVLDRNPFVFATSSAIMRKDR